MTLKLSLHLSIYITTNKLLNILVTKFHFLRLESSALPQDETERKQYIKTGFFDYAAIFFRFADTVSAVCINNPVQNCCRVSAADISFKK
jgi:hypothetical protein